MSDTGSKELIENRGPYVPRTNYGLGDRSDTPVKLSTDEQRVLGLCRKSVAWLRALLSVVDHPDWGEITLVVKHGEVEMVKSREDKKLSED